jgi:hypothetical protein
MLHTLQATVIGMEPTGESFVRVHLFSAHAGCSLALKRKSTKKGGSSHLDLFQDAELVIKQESEHAVGFIQENTVFRTRQAIARRYEAFDCASRFCRIIHLNARHMTHPEPITALLQTSLDAWEQRPHPQATLLKALYRLASEDGFPVRESWLQQLSPSLRSDALAILHRSLDEQQHTPQMVENLVDSLMGWLSREQDFIF